MPVANGRATLTLSPEAEAALRDLERQTGKSYGALLGEAIALRQAYERTLRDGGKVLTEHCGRFKELLLP